MALVLRRLFERIYLVRKTKDLRGMRSQRQVHDAVEIRRPESPLDQRPLSAVEERAACRILAELLISQVGEFVREGDRRILSRMPPPRQ